MIENPLFQKKPLSRLCQSRFGVRIPNRQTFEIDRKLDILVIALVYIMIEGGVIKAFIVAPCFIKRSLIDFALFYYILETKLETTLGHELQRQPTYWRSST
jgi:hypothetical protein